MIKFSEAEANALNNSSPALQNTLIGTKMKELQENSGAVDEDVSGVTIAPLVTLQYEISADATLGLAILNANAPFGFTIIDVIVEGRATVGGGTALLSTGGNAITDAIPCAVDTTKTNAILIDDAYSTIAEGGSLTVTTANAADRGLVTILATVV